MPKKYINVEEFLNTVENLPVFPEILTKINQLLKDENSSAEDVSKIIMQDQYLTAKILKIANSAFYGRINNIVNINEAVVVIGLKNINSMLLSIYLEQFFGIGKQQGISVLENLWKHALITAKATSSLIDSINPALTETMYSAGLLHDIGELILLKYEPELYNETLKEIKIEGGNNRLLIEETIFGFSHADLGAAMARKWNLPKIIKDTIFFHHIPKESESNKDLIFLLHVVDKSCAFLNFGGTDIINTQNINEIFDKEILEYLNLNSENLINTIENTIKNLEIV